MTEVVNMPAKVINKYSFWIGLWKSIKNTTITLGSAAITHLLLTYTQWIPTEYLAAADTVAAILAYLLKNKIQFNNK